MVIFRFHPHHDLYVMASMKDYPEFPFDEDQLVTVKLRVAIPFSVETSDEAYKAYNARFQTLVTPEGQSLPEEDAVLTVVTAAGDEAVSHSLLFLAYTNSILVALFTGEDQALLSQLREVRVAQVPLVISHIKESGISDLWTALLYPSGDKVDGLILSEVVLLE